MEFMEEAANEASLYIDPKQQADKYGTHEYESDPSPQGVVYRCGVNKNKGECPIDD